MITNKRLENIKKEIERKKGKLVIIKFNDNTELKIMPSEILNLLTSIEANKDNSENEFVNAIKGKEIVSCSSYDKLIDLVKQLV